MIDFALWVLGIPAAILYVGILVIFVRSKSVAFRTPCFVLAILLAFLGKSELGSLDNQFGVFNVLFFIPVAVGICTEYVLRKKPPVT
jgi:hypothetical protein